MKFTLFAIMLCLMAGATFGQADPSGVADTIALVPRVCPEAGVSGQLVLDLYAFSDEPLAVAHFGFSWDNPKLHLDSAVATPLARSGFDLICQYYAGANIDVSNDTRRFLFYGRSLMSQLAADASGRRQWATYYFTVTGWTTSDVVVFDSLTFDADSAPEFVTYPSGTSFAPEWGGGSSCGSATASSNIVAAPAALSFSGTQGCVAPAAQTIQVTSDNGTLTCSSTATASWLGLSTNSVETPLTLTVGIDLTGLTAGIYADTVTITSANAENSPVLIPVSLTVVPGVVITACPAAVDTFVCEGSTVCALLTVENADQVVSTLGGSIGDGTICWTATGDIDAVDTIVATNHCGADTCIIPVTIAAGSPPTIACVDTTIVIERSEVSPYCFALPVTGATGVTVTSIPDGLVAVWSDSAIRVDIDGLGSYHVVVTAENVCGVVACTIGVSIVESPVIPTNEWVSLWCETAHVDGVLLQAGDLIEVLDPDGVLCGMASANANGGYGYLNVYRDDPYTPADEGADPGDLLLFRINGVATLIDSAAVWTAHGDIISMCEFATQVCRTLTLSTGWNLVSWNLECDMPVETMLAELNGCVDVVLSLEDEGGVVYDPDLPEFSTLDTVDHRHGYWFRMLCPATIELCGIPLDRSERLSVRAGWNLLSYWPEETLPVDDAMASVTGCAQVALGFDDGGRVWVPGMDLYNTLGSMSPGFGYWLKSTCDTALVYPGFLAGGAPKVQTARNGMAALSPYWLSVYGADLEVDGRAVAPGSRIEFRTADGIACGCGIYDGRRLAFTPVYGRMTVRGLIDGLPLPGDTVGVWLDGVSTGYSFAWTRQGDRVELTGLSSSSSDTRSDAFRLCQNYPNPFNPRTEIRFDLPQAGPVRLSIYNLLGQPVRTLIDRRLEVGSHSVEWDGVDNAGEPVASGVYFYRLEAGENRTTRKMLLLK